MGGAGERKGLRETGMSTFPTGDLLRRVLELAKHRDAKMVSTEFRDESDGLWHMGDSGKAGQLVFAKLTEPGNDASDVVQEVYGLLETYPEDALLEALSRVMTAVMHHNSLPVLQRYLAVLKHMHDDGMAGTGQVLAVLDTWIQAATADTSPDMNILVMQSYGELSLIADKHVYNRKRDILVAKNPNNLVIPDYNQVRSKRQRDQAARPALHLPKLSQSPLQQSASSSHSSY